MSLVTASRGLILSAASPLMPALGKVAWPCKRLLGDSDVDSFLVTDPLPGTSLLSRKRLQLTNRCIAGWWKHYAMYAGVWQRQHWVVEAVWPRVQLVPLEHWMKHEDYVCAQVPTFMDEDLMALSLEWALRVVGLPYDRQMKFARSLASNRAFYCSEVGWWAHDKAYMQRYGKPSPFVLRKTWGVDTCLPNDLYASDKFKLVWQSATATAALAARAPTPLAPAP